VPSCADGGVLGALCGTVGSLMAAEAVKLVCGIGEPLVGRLLVLDALGAAWRTIPVRPAPVRVPVTELADYDAFCGVTPSLPADEIAPRRLAELLEEQRELLLVDVREPDEHALVAIPGAVNVPLAQLQADPSALADPGRRIVLYCKTGARSARALAALRAAGVPDVVHVAGGVVAWVRDVEPHKSLY
jgi:adenylyltransferase/sulfurtransferase